MPIPTIAEIAGIFLLAGLVKGVVGLGLPTVAIGLLGLMMAPAQAAALLVVPSLVTNIWQAAAGAALWPLVKRLWTMFVGIFAGTWLTGGIITGADSALATAALGSALIVYAAFGLSRFEFSLSPAAERWLAAPVGLTTGLVAGATGIFTLPAVPYLQAIGLQKDDLVQALGLSFTVSTLSLAAALANGGALHTGQFVGSGIALAASLAGMGLGQFVRVRVRAERFRIYFFVGLLLLGAHLALRPFI